MSSHLVFSEPDAKIKIVPLQEQKTLTVDPIHSPESIGTDAIKKFATQLFAPGGKLGAFFGAVKADDIKMHKTISLFRPYWRVTAGYACRYLRKHNHKLLIEDDVEAVTIHDHAQNVKSEIIKLSDMLADIGSSTSLGYGPVKLSLGSLQGLMKNRFASALGGKDKEMDKKVELNVDDVIETAAYTYTGRFLFDGNSGMESKEIFDKLSERDLQPTAEAKLKRQGDVVPATYTKEEVIREVETRLHQEPTESPHRILEQEVRMTELSLIYVPSFGFTAEYKGKARTFRLDGITGEFKAS